MDYPKSVPNVGLVDGHFVDEDPVAGTVGSLIPAAWGDAVTQEILNAITAAGLVPDESDVSQLAAAIKWFSGGISTTVAASTVLTKAQSGLVLASAAAGAITVTLPAANAATGVVEVVLRRTDSSANVLTIAAAGADKIMLDVLAAAAGLSSTELLFAGDYLRLRSDGAGKWWCVGQAQLPPSLASVVTKYSVAGVSTYTVPAIFRSGRRRARVTVTGGGAGGGHNEYAPGTTRAGGGGGGGGKGTSILDLYGISSVTVTVGIGGAGGAAGGINAGAAGGSSSFGAYISSTGGVGGTQPGGGPAGTTTGDIVHPVSAAGSGTEGSIGHGGGYGGVSQAASIQIGPSGIGPGGGGAGGVGNSGARGGGSGKPGEVMVEVA